MHVALRSVSHTIMVRRCGASRQWSIRTVWRNARTSLRRGPTRR